MATFLRLLIVNSLYPPAVSGGAELSVAGLVSQLRELGCDVKVATLAGPSPVDPDLDPDVLRIPLANIYWPFDRDRPSAPYRLVWHSIDRANPVMARRFETLLRRIAPDIVHTNNLAGFSTAVWRITRDAGIPLVHTLRDRYLLCARSTGFRSGRSCTTPCADCWALRFGFARQSRQVQAVTALSASLLGEHLERGYFQGTLARVIPNAIEPPERLSALPVTEGGPVRFGFLGRLSPEKGLEVLLNAFRSAIQMNGIRAQLLIGGEGGRVYEQRLRDTFSDELVTFLGWVDPSSFLAKIDVLVVPSLWREPFGRVVIEAWAHGRPVLASSRGALDELLSSGGGWRFDPDSPTDLRDKLVNIASRPSAIISASSKALECARKFTPNQVYRRYLEIYEQCIESPSPPG